MNIPLSKDDYKLLLLILEEYGNLEIIKNCSEVKENKNFNIFKYVMLIEKLKKRGMNQINKEEYVEEIVNESKENNKYNIEYMKVLKNKIKGDNGENIDISSKLNYVLEETDKALKKIYK